jgi:SOS-response transcriptional repressor LexA
LVKRSKKKKPIVIAQRGMLVLANVEEQSQSVGSILAMIRKERGLSHYRVGRLTGMNPTAIKDIEEGKNKNPGVETLTRITDALDVDLGNVLMAFHYARERKGATNKEIVDSLDKILTGPPTSLLADHDAPREERIIHVPIVGAAPGGPTEEAIHYGDEQYGVLRHLMEQKRNRFVIRLFGDSMFPTYWPGDLLLVDSAAKVKDGDIAVVRVGTGSTVKRVRMSRGRVVSLLADNPSFKPREIVVGPDDELVIDGKVLAIVKGERP